jgi:hypothetical protein
VKKLTRRWFLQQTPISAATISLLPAMPALAAIRHSPKAAAAQLSTTSQGSIFVHVNNVASGEMTLLVDTRAIVLRDPRIVASFLDATREGGSA